MKYYAATKKNELELYQLREEITRCLEKSKI